MFLFCSWKRISGIYSKVLTRTYSTGGMKGRLTGVSVGNVLVASYSYDAVGRIAGINNISFGYLANSNLLSTAARPNNVNTVWNYEADRDLVTSVENKLNSAVISKYAYTNDAIGRRTAMARSGSVFSASDTLSYLYNDRSEVTGANSNAADSLYHYAYSFDNIGNRLTANLAGTPWTYTANNLNQYTAFTKNQVAETPSYDDDGNMLTRDGWVQTWNAENRLIKAEKGTTKLEFAYDYMGRRIFKKVYSSGTLTSYTRFVYDGYKLMEELDALNNNAVLRRYAWSTVGLDVPVSVYDAVANAMYYYHTDANKNITELTNASGSIVAHYEYSPFGKVIVSTGSYAGTNPFRFSSEYHDDETGLVYYNYRYYSPELGRWLSRDPIGERGGVNLYGMVGNNVMCIYDIFGLRKPTQEEKYVITNLKKLIDNLKEVHPYKKGLRNVLYNIVQTIENTKDGCPLESNMLVLIKALKNFFNPAAVYCKEDKKYLCSTFVRASALKQAGFKATIEANAALYLNGTDEQWREIGLNLPITTKPNPGDIVSSGPVTAKNTNEAHTGIYIGEGLYIGQSPNHLPNEIVSDKNGSTIKIRAVDTMPCPRIIYRST